MHELHALIERVAATDVTVTLLGETGVGKDVCARLIHAHSPRAARPMVVFDCGAVSRHLIESELFGHERGAFTGAEAAHPGALERAEGGTLFLDEVGELPLDLQPRLLRVLEQRAARRVGGSKERRVNARVLAATNRDLGRLVAAGAFRQDLYFRLAAAVVRIPPLRERREDIPALASALLRDLGRDDVELAPAALAALGEHSWPGNVRELKNVLAYALAVLDGPVIEAAHLQFVAHDGHRFALDRLPLAGHSLHNLERTAIEQTLARARGDRDQAARMLGVPAPTLADKLATHGLRAGGDRGEW